MNERQHALNSLCIAPGALASFTRLFLGKEGLLLTVHACAKLLDTFSVKFPFYQKKHVHVQTKYKFVTGHNESTAGADASVEALKLYHMKLT